MPIWNPAAETMSRANLDQLIRERLRYTVRYAYENSPFYHETFRARKVYPNDIRDVRDLRKLPIVTKKDVVANQPPTTQEFRFFSAPQQEMASRHATSGSRGTPKWTACSYDDWKASAEVCSRAYAAAEISRGERVVNFLPLGVNMSGMKSTRAFQEFGAEVITPGVLTIPSRPYLIKMHKPSVLFGSSSLLARLYYELMEDNQEPESTGIKKILTVGEPSTAEKRKEIGRRFNAEVFDEYASNEGDLMAYECSEHNGLHVKEGRVLLNPIDLETGELLEDGKEGADCLTTLLEPGKYAGMVLLNYHHGDGFKVLSSEQCGCGRTLKRISHPNRVDGALELGICKGLDSDIEAALYSGEYNDYFTGEFEIFVGKEWDESYRAIIKVESVGREDSVPHSVKEQFLRDVIERNYVASIVIQSGVAKIFIQPTNRGDLEVLRRPGKPQRIITTKP